MKRISVDIGGTFTDCFLVWEKRYIQAKALTTHHNLAVGFNDALDNACNELELSRYEVLSEVDSVRYATTLGTNALIERKGPRVAALVTHGFEHTIHLSRGRGYGEGLDKLKQQDLGSARRPDPLVDPLLVRSLRERISSTGEVLATIDERDVRLQIRELMDAGAEAIVVVLTNSVENSVHELRVQEIFNEDFPAHQLGAIPMLLSHQVAGRKGEYARASSTIVDAYLHSIMYHALSMLAINLREMGYEKPMLVIHNSGGMAQLNSTDSLQTIHSGPIAGIGATEHLAAETNLGNVIATDMGGTSFDIGLVPAGGVKHYDFLPTIDRWLVSVPMVHLQTLGAGGGSIASYNRMHHGVAIGPESAGSDPGPACYDRGGTRPTVTDADLVLGYLDPGYYADGTIQLSAKRAWQAIEDELCDPLDRGVVEVAKVIKRNVDLQMAMGISKELRVRGYDPSEFTMLAYGGNGPLHCCGVANELGIDRILAPPMSAVFSALGAGNMRQMHIHERSTQTRLYDASTRRLFSDLDQFNAIVVDLEAKGTADLVRQGFDASHVSHQLELDMRYGNQLVTTAVVSDKSRLRTVRDVLHLIQQFSDDYGRRFGQGSQAPEAGIRVQTVRVAAYVESEKIAFDPLVNGHKRVRPEPTGHRQCHLIGVDEPVDVPIFNGDALTVSTVISGPAIATTPSTTYLVEPGWRLEPTAQGAVWFLRDVTTGSR